MLPSGGGGLDAVRRQTGRRVDQLASAGDHLDARAEQLGVDVGGLIGGQGLDALVDLRQRDLGVVDVDVEAQMRRTAQFGAHTGGGDEGLRRHTVEQHAAPPMPSESMTVTWASRAAATSAAS